ncbi:carbamoyl-phosphate synthase large subunit [Methanococcus maripaludis]|uniref:Carbamoyl phosphate synthase large chain n=1 Tax=Methanococcus maripaludis TaxID=39152 RepID=A0A7J9NP02_METMI|nr:carbamoyl-phosphate synthase large subunit [Methanococcus maripaludis]MBA2846902.1 carbamoyl-phosphate synthase large subunit [Methanococcus maripaludis]
MKREDIKKVMILGSGPIVIGQAAEFDFSGSQACKSLKEEGIYTILVNSNPATIQTDTNIADKVYLEPLNPKILEKIIEKEHPDAILPTMGGQTGLNLAMELSKRGILEKHGVELLGSTESVIETSEDRDLFNKAMEEINQPIAKSAAVHSVEEAIEATKELGYPAIVRPAFTLGGTGGGIATNEEELIEITKKGLKYSMIKQVLIDQSLLGWKEYEYEVMRDKNDTCIVVCNMENIDPMGIHTGESIVTAPSQTLSDEFHQKLRDASLQIIRHLKIEGGCNVQFAVNPEMTDYVVIEVNPRVSRSSALASKATGYPIAKIAAKIAIGRTLDEIQNDVTKETPASFEPTIDYVVVKIPRWPFDKFRTVDKKLGTSMKSTGEIMAIGRNLEEALQKAVRSLDIGRFGIIADGKDKEYSNSEIVDILEHATDERLFVIAYALDKGWSVDGICERTGINPFFIEKIKKIIDCKKELEVISRIPVDDEKLKEILLKAKSLGFSDVQISKIFSKTENEIRDLRKRLEVIPVYKMVDTCAAEFEAKTPYYYSAYERYFDEEQNESIPSDRKKVIILGSGPIRIGQGVEFDYSTVHAIFALKELGIEAIIVNNNPETVSTDYDTSDKLYFEPLVYEEIMNIIENENKNGQLLGVIVQFGGQTAINLAMKLYNSGVNILGTSPQSIDLAEDRDQFIHVLEKLKIPQADGATAFSEEQALKVVERIGYPALVRPSYVLGGRAMQIVYNTEDLKDYMREAVKVSSDHPILIDKFLEEAVEVDVDAVCDGESVFIGAIMEHIEEAGIHSGDSACVIPPQTLSKEVIEKIAEHTTKLALELGVIGLLNIQYAVKDGVVYIIEANPRASRTIPYVSKSVGVPLAKIATNAIMGKKLKEMGYSGLAKSKYVSVKEAVFPFLKLPGVDPVLSPEMKSTGEAIGIDQDFGKAFYKSQLSANMELPTSGTVFISVRNRDKDNITKIAKKYHNLGFEIVATRGTARELRLFDIPVREVRKISESMQNSVLDLMQKGEVDLIINTSSGDKAKTDGYFIRRAAVELNIPCMTTLQGAYAAIKAIEAIKSGELGVYSLNELEN